MEGNLGTTNIMLGIIAAVSVLEALLLIGAGVAGFIAYRRVMAVVNVLEANVNVLEANHVAPAMARVNGILDDVKGVTAKLREETERVDEAIRTTMDRVDDTAERVRWNVRAKTSRVVGFLRGLRVALEQLLTTHPQEPRTQHP
jgi:uncharacterized protein YoxC